MVGYTSLNPPGGSVACISVGLAVKSPLICCPDEIESMLFKSVASLYDANRETCTSFRLRKCGKGVALRALESRKLRW